MNHIQTLFVDENLQSHKKRIANLCSNNSLLNVVAKNVNKRYLEDQEGHWLADFATQSYLGFDFNEQIIEAVINATRQYGAVVAWCRLVATVDLFIEAEESVAKLVRAEACSIFASTTLLNHGVIPALAGNEGLILLDKDGHGTLKEGALLAQAQGARIIKFDSKNITHLEKILLRTHKTFKKKLILTNGVISRTGDYPDLPSLNMMAQKYDALVYVDDAHGFGVVGEKPSFSNPYGLKGNGLLNYYNLNYDNMVYVGCFSKAYGSFGAFIACTKKLKKFLLSQATPHDLGGAGPASAIAAVLTGLKINELEGEEIRKRIFSLTRKARKGLQELGYVINGETLFPIINVCLGKVKDIQRIAKILYDNHILVTLYPYPMVKITNNSLRITVTASNTEAEIDQLIKAFQELKVYLLKKGYPF